MEKCKKSALLVGCNYPNTKFELKGCHRDVLVLEQTLSKMFKFNEIEVLIDKPSSKIMPTGSNIKQALNRMIDQVQPGDLLFFYFAGHGTLVPSSPKEEEAIVPCDSNLITSVDFRYLVDKVPKGATFTVLADSGHSGGLIDKEPEQVGPNHPPTRNIASISPYRPRMIPYESIVQQLSSITSITFPHVGDHLLQMFDSDTSLMFRLSPQDYPRTLEPNEGILLSGCQSDELSLDVPVEKGGPYGAFSNAVEIVLKENPISSLSNKQVVIMARKVLEMQGITQQHPCLYCSKANADAIFLSNGN